MEYTVVFDALQSGYRNWWFPAFGLVFVLTGSRMLARRKALSSWERGFSAVFLGFALLWTLSVLLLTGGDHLKLAAALREGRCAVAEGIVADFQAMPASGKGRELFSVDGRQFRYSQNVVSPGFNQTVPRGGPMRAGLQVRIHHVGNDIARLEIAK